jgi:hypothetical protein
MYYDYVAKRIVYPTGYNNYSALKINQIAVITNDIEAVILTPCTTITDRQRHHYNLIFLLRNAELPDTSHTDNQKVGQPYIDMIAQKNILHSLLLILVMYKMI